MNEIIFTVKESSDGGYSARALGASKFTEAESIESLKEMVRDAVKCHFDQPSLSRIIRLHFVKEEVRAA